MKRFVFVSAAVIAVVAVTLGLYAQPAGGGGFGGGGGGGFGGGGFGGGGFGGGGMMGGMSTERPDKEARLASIKQLEDQVKTLKAAIEKAPAKDPNFATLSEEERTKALEYYQPEQDAVQAIQTTLASLNGGGIMAMFSSTGELSSVRVLAKSERATKTITRLDELIKEQMTNPFAGMRGMRGGGMMGGGGGFGGGGRRGGGFGGGGAGGN